MQGKLILLIFNLLFSPVILADNITKACIALHDAIESKNTNHKGYKVAYKLLKPHENSNPFAQRHISWIYFFGAGGISRDEDKAHELVLLSAKAGVISSQHQVARNYEKGIGSARDFDLAIKWYEIAARSGSYAAADRLVKIYSKGELGKSIDSELSGVWREVRSGCVKEPFDPCKLKRVLP